MLLSNDAGLPLALSAELLLVVEALVFAHDGEHVSIHLFFELKGSSKSLSCDATIEATSIPLFSFVKDSVKRRIAVSVSLPLIILSSSGAESSAPTNDVPLQRRATSTSDFREAGVGSDGLASADLISRK